MLSQAEAAVQSARQVAYPTKPSFALGFMIGHDTTWLPAALKILRDELPNIHVVISTQNSPQLATALLHGGIVWPSCAEKTEALTWISGLWSKSRSKSSCLRITRLQPGAPSIFRKSPERHLSAFPERPSAYQANSRRYAGRLTGFSMRLASKSDQAMRWIIWAASCLSLPPRVALLSCHSMQRRSFQMR